MRKLLFASIVLAASLGCEAETAPLAQMAAHHRGEMSPAIPILAVDSLKRAEKHYVDVLGFTLEWEDGSPPDFAAVKRSDAVYFLCQQCQGTGGAWSMVFVKDVDKLYAELKQKQARITQPPRDMPWQLREMHVVDLDANVIRFGSPIRR